MEGLGQWELVRNYSCVWFKGAELVKVNRVRSCGPLCAAYCVIMWELAIQSRPYKSPHCCIIAMIIMYIYSIV